MRGKGTGLKTRHYNKKEEERGRTKVPALQFQIRIERKANRQADSAAEEEEGKKKNEGKGTGLKTRHYNKKEGERGRTEVPALHKPDTRQSSLALNEGSDLALLEAVAIGIEGELDGEHESEYEESQEDGLVELRAPNAGDYSCDHDERANAGERAEKKDACGATEIGGRNDAKRDIGQNERSVRKKDKEHAPCGFH